MHLLLWVVRELTSRNEFWPTVPNKDVDLTTTLEMLEDVLSMVNFSAGGFTSSSLSLCSLLDVN